MKQWLFLFLSAISPAFSSPLKDSAITYPLSTGRFADRLLGYLHGKWASYYSGLPLLYKPFTFSDEFALDQLETRWTEEAERGLAKNVMQGLTTLEAGVLYEVPFFSECPDDELYNSIKPPFVVDWQDPSFRRVLKQAFAPKKPRMPFLPETETRLTVALHVRRGGGFDVEHPHLLYPLRFAPDSYYIASLRRLVSLFPNQPIYAYIFTDDVNPGQIAGAYAQALADLPIQFDCRREGNHYDANIVEDFFAMMEFTCLIRSQSNYSLIPAVIADYKVVIAPTHFTWQLTSDFRIENKIDQISITGSLID